MLGLALILCSTPSRLYSDTAEEGIREGDELKTDAHYQKLLEADPDNPLLHYNQGTAAYTGKRFEKALASFDRALTTDDLALQEKTYYNRANALYRLGQSALQNEPERTLEAWRDAVASYENALSLNPDNTRAEANHRFVSEKLEELEKQQERQNEQEQNSENEPDSNNGQQSGQQPQDRDSRNRESQNTKKPRQPVLRTIQDSTSSPAQRPEPTIETRANTMSRLARTSLASRKPPAEQVPSKPQQTRVTAQATWPPLKLRSSRQR